MVKTARRFFGIDIGGFSREFRIAFVRDPYTHLSIERLALGHMAAQYFLNLDPIFPVVLLKHTPGVESANILPTKFVLDFFGRISIDHHKRPDLHLIGAARMPAADGIDPRKK